MSHFTMTKTGPKFRADDAIVATLRATIRDTRAALLDAPREDRQAAVAEAAGDLLAFGLDTGAIVVLDHECLRCAGLGRVHWRHVEAGRCFACDGAGLVTARESMNQLSRAWKGGAA